MTVALAAALLGIALVDSLNPSALVVTTVLLAGADPRRRALAYIAGIATTYYALGVVVVLGAGDLVTSAVDLLSRPSVGFGLEALIGLVLVGFTLRRPDGESSAPPVRGTSLLAAFVTGMTITAVESTTALPYVGALTALVRADVPLGQTLLALLAYNLVFVLPALLLVVVHVIRPDRVASSVARVRSRLRALDTRLTRALLLVLGVLMLADATYYFVRGEAVG